MSLLRIRIAVRIKSLTRSSAVADRPRDASILSVCSQLQQYSTSSAVFYDQLFRLQIYNCVLLDYVLLSSAQSRSLPVINKIMRGASSSISRDQQRRRLVYLIPLSKNFDDTRRSSNDRFKTRYWSKIAIFAPLWGSPSDYCHNFWCGKTTLCPNKSSTPNSWQ